MFSRVRQFWLLLLCACTAHVSQAQNPVATAQTHSPKPGLHALVMANEAYAHLSRAPVTHSVGDARSVKEALELVGFTVRFEPDVPDVSTMLAIEGRFLAALSPGDKVLFYFSGYGIQDGVENYLVPTNYKYNPKRTGELSDDAYQVTRLQQYLALRKLDFAIMVLDACRAEDTLRKEFDRDGLTYPSDKTTPTLIALPTHPGEFVRKEVPGQQRGLFASAFIDALAKPGLNLTAFFDDVKKTVSQVTKSEQVPTVVLNNITSDFYFVPPIIKVDEPKTIHSDTDRLTYIRIPGGTFTMGCVTADPDCDPAEMKAHGVTLSRFWIGNSEVTVKAFQQFVSGPKVKGRTQKKGQMPRAPLWNSGWKFTDRPVVSVPWEQAQAYCAWVGGRLPTEAEWEYAARGGREATIYPWGNTYDPKWAATSVETPQPAETYPPNDYGMYDMIGNVWEWTQDVYDPDYYQKSAGAIDPKGPTGTGLHVKRGGSYVGRPQDLRTSIRRSLAGADNITGFRCVLDQIPRSLSE